jgi:crotonobetainyl-CoA:carnitine CoA-transferase CaiB-like acyl-CoA transferase
VDLLDGYVADWIAERTRDEVMDAFEAAEAAIAPIYDVAELMDDPHAQAREMFVSVKDPTLGPVKMQNVLFRMSETPGSIEHTGRPLGADTDEILGEIGVPAEKIAVLRERGVVG